MPRVSHTDSPSVDDDVAVGEPRDRVAPDGHLIEGDVEMLRLVAVRLQHGFLPFVNGDSAQPVDVERPAQNELAWEVSRAWTRHRLPVRDDPCPGTHWSQGPRPGQGRTRRLWSRSRGSRTTRRRASCRIC